MTPAKLSMLRGTYALTAMPQSDVCDKSVALALAVFVSTAITFFRALTLISEICPGVNESTNAESFSLLQVLTGALGEKITV